ncbi:AGAP008517-PA, partial [Anopheles gambiae str. PEST]
AEDIPCVRACARREDGSTGVVAEVGFPCVSKKRSKKIVKNNIQHISHRAPHRRGTELRKTGAVCVCVCV